MLTFSERSRRTLIAVVCLITVAAASIFPVLTAQAAPPLENPDTAPVVYDGTALLQKLSQAAGLVPLGDTASLKLLLSQSTFANIPPELKTTVDNFLSSSLTIASIIPELQSELEYAKSIQAQYRIADSAPVLASAKEKLTRAYAGLLVMDSAALRTGSWWKVAALKDNNSLNVTYYNLQGELQDIRGLLVLLDSMYSSMLLTRTDASLRSSNLSILIDPETAFVGDKITVQGILKAAGDPLAGRIITILVDNAPAGSVLTDSTGAYQKTITVPFKYVPVMKVQAVFYPVGTDVGQFLGASSRQIDLKVLFYQTFISASQGTPANPGRDFLVTAVLSYNGSPAAEGRNLTVYLDGKTVFESSVGPTAFLNLPVADNTSPGTYKLSFYVPPMGRYSPAEYSMPVEVNLLAPVIEVNTSRLLFLPFAREIKGRVHSPAGPLNNAAVDIAMGGWKASAVTREDGTFTARFDTGLSLTLIGRQVMRITIVPSEPWNSSGSLDIPFMVTNPLSIAAILLVLAIPTWLFFRRGKRVRLVPPSPGQAPEPQQEIEVNNLKVKASSPFLNLYKGVLALIQAASGQMLQSYQTLGEFAVEAGPKLGLLAAYFQEFTRIIERQLYSNRANDDGDTERAKELSRTLTTGIKK